MANLWSNGRTMTSSGDCLCGSISFAVELPSKWVAHCHCTKCRRAHGAAFVTWVSVADTGVMITDPELLLRWFVSSAEGQRGFCSRCGSTLFFRSTQWPGEIHITRANFSSDIDRRPQSHSYYDTHVDWVTIEDNLAKISDPNAPNKAEAG